MPGPWEAYAAQTFPPSQPVQPPGPWTQYALPSSSASPLASYPVVDSTTADDIANQGKPANSNQPSRGVLGAVDDAARSVEQGFTLGLGPRIDAAESAVEQPLFGAGSNAPTLGQRYSENLAANQ